MKSEAYCREQLAHLLELRKRAERLFPKVPDHMIVAYCVGGIWMAMEMLEEDNRGSLVGQVRMMLKAEDEGLIIRNLDGEEPA